MGVLWVDIAPNMKQDVIYDRYAYGSGGCCWSFHGGVKRFDGVLKNCTAGNGACKKICVEREW